MKTVLAHYSRAKAARSVVGISCVLLGVLLVWLFTYEGHLIPHLMQRPGTLFAMVLSSSVAFGYFFVVELLILRQMLFGRSEALWIQDGFVIYLHKLYLSAACKDVQSIDAGPFGLGGHNVISLGLRGGRQMRVPTDAFTERQEDVMARLKQEIASQQ